MFQAKVTEFQSFRVTYPEPDEETVRMMMQQEGGEEEQQSAVSGQQEVEAKIRELAGQGLSMTAIVREIWKSGAGDAFAWRSAMVKKVISEGA